MAHGLLRSFMASRFSGLAIVEAKGLGLRRRWQLAEVGEAHIASASFEAGGWRWGEKAAGPPPHGRRFLQPKAAKKEHGMRA